LLTLGFQHFVTISGHNDEMAAKDVSVPKYISLFGRRIRMPQSVILRVALGIAAIIGGVFSFLPVLGVWMLPLGLLILSIDFPVVRRWRRKMTVKLVGMLKRRFPRLAAKIGLTV
jgi:hypothetical protein